MFLSSLTLKNFRLYKKAEFKFKTGSTIFIGPNTVGKTNLLESIYFLSYGKSFRAQKDRECIFWGESLARIEGKIESDKSEITKLEVVLTTGEINGQKTPYKKFLVNEVSRRFVDFVGNFKSVIFKPEDLELIIDSPSIRREYLDTVLCLVDREYRRSLLSYQKGLRQRNRLLFLIREGKANRQQLFYWDKLLIKNGNLITSRRQEFIDFLNSHIDIFSDLEIEYDLSGISEERLEKYKDEEVLAGVTLVGPHRDDFIVYQKKQKILRDVHSYGSRGEQRLAVLSLKLCELDFVEKKSGERPILLLDDIFSELDEDHRNLITKVINNQQTIITATDLQFINDFKKELVIVELDKV